MNELTPFRTVAAFATLLRLDADRSGMTDVLRRVTELAQPALDGADEVSVTLLSDGHATSPAFTGPLALHCDQLQYSAGDGPCLHSARTGDVVHVDDLAAESRWTGYTERALESSVRGSLSVPLPVPEPLAGALNIYARTPHAFGAGTLTRTQTLLDYAAISLANAAVHAAAVEQVAQMREAMASRAVIEQAKGIVMRERGCDADAAFEVLVALSSSRNRKLREIASDLVASVTASPALPGTPAAD